MTDNCGYCAFCMKTSESKSSSCDSVRGKLSRIKFKERKRNFEKKYTLTEVLSEREVSL